MNKYTPRKSKLGIICVQSTSNNTIITLHDLQGNTQCWISAGGLGFKGSRKSTTYAAGAAAEQLAEKAIGLGFYRVRVRLKGLGFGKESAVRALHKAGLSIQSVADVTPTPYNGCRPPKKRRV